MIDRIPKVRAKYSPRNWAREFHNAPQRWKVLVLHRRCGKTTACLNQLIKDALWNPKARYAYIAPLYKQAKQVAWDMLKDYCEVIPGVRFYENELRADFENGSRIQLFGADNPDALRGLGLWGVVFDEYSQQPSSIFTEVVGPALADHKGYAIWIGTPKGRNDFYRIYHDNENDPDWYCKTIRASESGILAQAELDIQRKNSSLDEYNQEFECSFDAAIKGAYYSAQLLEARQQNRICTVPHRTDAKVDTFWDLGMSDTTCIIFVQKCDRELHVIDYYENNGSELEHYSTELRRRGYDYGKHFVPHDIKVRELGTGRSRYELLGQQLGKDKLYIVPSIPIKDGIDASRKLFQRCWFDTDKCAKLLDALASYTQEWNDKKGMFRDKPLHNWASHASDAFRMLGVGFREETTYRTNSVKSKYNKPGGLSTGTRHQLGSKPVRSKYNSPFKI